MKLTNCLTVLTLVCTACLAQAADPAPSASPLATKSAPSSTMKKSSFRGIIDNVDVAAGKFTVNNKDKTTKTYKVGKETKVTKGGAEATLADAKVGDEVRGSALKTGEGEYNASSVKIGPKTAEETAADLKKKEDKAAKASATP